MILNSDTDINKFYKPSNLCDLKTMNRKNHEKLLLMNFIYLKINSVRIECVGVRIDYKNKEKSGRNKCEKQITREVDTLLIPLLSGSQTK